MLRLRPGAEVSAAAFFKRSAAAKQFADTPTRLRSAIRAELVQLIQKHVRPDWRAWLLTYLKDARCTPRSATS